MYVKMRVYIYTGSSVYKNIIKINIRVLVLYKLVV